MPPPPPPDVALLRRVLDGLRRLQTDPPADLAMPSTAPQAVPQPPAQDLPPLAPRLPHPPPPLLPRPAAERADAAASQRPEDEFSTVPGPHRPLPPRPARRSGVPGGPAFLGAAGMTMPAADEHAPPYSVDKTNIVSIS